MSETKPLAAAPSADRAAAPSSRGFARSLRDNAIGIFPPQAFEQDVVFRKVFGRRQIIVSRPAAIQRILVDNPENYRRTAAGIRILRPLLGRGLLLSRGEDWRHQRRTLAPAFAPRTMPILCGPRGPRRRRRGRLRSRLPQPARSTSWRRCSFWRWRSPAPRCFRSEMARYGAELRGLIKAYAARLGRPSLLDFMLPPSLPSPRDVLRWRFRRRWLKLIRRIIAARRDQVSAGDAAAAPRDLFDLMSTARDPETGALFPPERLADQVATMIVAGHETTAVALFWSLYLLAGAPDIQERLAAEVAGADLGPGHAAELLPRLVYTRAVVHEALRLYPPAFTLARQALAADTAGGIPIAARTVV